MAVVDDRGHSDYPGPPEEPAGDFGRQPPQDMVAEQSVLGGMLLSKDAIADVLEVLRPGDFYRPAHQAVYDAVLDLYSRGEPADPVTVSAELDRRGELRRIGGAAYLVTLTQTVPTAANASYYAEIVAEKAILRRLVEAGTRIVQYGYAGSEGQDVAEVVDRAQAEIFEVSERRTSEDFVPLEELLQPTMDEIDSIASRGGISLGVPTGFAELDEVTNGLHPGQMIIVAARPGVGKALALDTPLPTPGGWTTMGEVAAGDELLDAHGRPTRVLAATEVLHGRPCFEVKFSDGTVLVADEQHQWVTSDGGPSRVRTTGEIAASLADGHVVGNVAALQLPVADLPVAPFTLGAWLGGPSADPHVHMRVQGEGGFAEELMTLGARIPGAYQRAAERQRRELLAGLLDAGGHVGDDGTVRFESDCARLRDDVAELLAGLGYTCTTTGSTVRFATDDDVFVLPSKAKAHKETRTGVPRERRIVAVRPVESVPVRCVEVDGEHLYLAGRSMIPTHNSTLGMDFLRSCSVKHGMASVMFSLEMGKTEIVMRLLSAEAKIKLGDMRSGRMTDDDWTRLARRMSEISEAPLYIDDSPNLTMMEIRAKARRLKQKHDIRLIVVDYLQLMTSGKKVESRQQEVSEFSRSLKLLAKELEVPVVAICQLNRGPEQRTDKKPMVSDLRESGCLTASTRVLRADNGCEVTLGELLASGEQPVVWSLDERMRMVARPMTKVFPSGRKEVFRLTLDSGRQVEATANHPFLTVDGWIPLGELTAGERVAVPRAVPAPLETHAVSEDDVVALAERTVADSSVPPQAFSLPKEQIAALVCHVWEGNGIVAWDAVEGRAAVRYPSADRRLADDLARLLLRIGVFARIAAAGTGSGWDVVVTGPENQAVFLHDVGAHGTAAQWVLAQLGPKLVRHDADTLTPDVEATLSRLLAVEELAPRELVAAAASRSAGGSRSSLAQVAGVLDTADIEMLATNNVYWDEIVSVTSIGEQDVFDGTVPGTHNFVADGISVHNSLEQDADMVILLHRPDAFERDDPRGGEADLILGKHRNGPTATITVAHQLHLSRFVDMARG
ncbi:replicative DNA helicase [Rhodococcus aetherivorans]|uniref:replicative DNA helicase n=1 Tax=Rhodococcus aetherivorans TaxID=191292 RepID=UPI0026ED9291|nr:replicative DNA helicase [Rhodococcus aetherivorans]WKW98616.1 replicative DNA helicase [Rhodococcus aetherivorans]